LDVFVFESVAEWEIFREIHKPLIFGRLRLVKEWFLLALQEGVW
jgi:hypothetical protein